MGLFSLLIFSRGKLVEGTAPIAASVFIMFASFGCSTSDKNSDTPEGLYAIAQELEEDERYEEAIRRYNEIRTTHPYSSVAVDAELAVAECYYKQESFPEAQVGYQAFKEMRPKHPKAAYVTHRIGLSLYYQLPETEDRDLSLAEKAIAHFDEVARSYPRSEFVAEANEKRQLVYKLLAGRELYVADFYLKKKKFESALGRYEEVLKKYQDFGFEERALVGAVRSSHRFGDNNKANLYFNQLRKKFSGSADLSSLKSELGL